MSVQILIPAYQPDEKLPYLVGELCLAYPVVVVDDGSGKEYAALFQRIADIGALVVHHETNRGKGAALKTGICAILAAGNSEGVITADADGQHTAGDISRIALAMQKNPNTLILGGRDFSQMPARSRFGNTMTRFFFRLCTGLHISDTQTGLRGLPASLLGRLATLPGDRYEYEMNMLLSLKEWGVPYLEIPIATVYLDGNRSSHFHALRDGWRVFSKVIKYALSSLSCTAVDYLLYLLFLTFLPVGWSYAAARVCSAGMNYFLNCKVVFKGKPTVGNFAGYALLAGFSMLMGSVTASALTQLGLNSVLAKLLIDACLFVINYLIQKKFLFGRAQGDGNA